MSRLGAQISMRDTGQRRLVRGPLKVTTQTYMEPARIATVHCVGVQLETRIQVSAMAEQHNIGVETKLADARRFLTDHVFDEFKPALREAQLALHNYEWARVDQLIRHVLTRMDDCLDAAPLPEAHQ